MVAAATLVAAGCAGQSKTYSKPHLSVRAVDHHADRPSNLAIFFTVHHAGGQPVVGLTPEEVRVYEGSRAASSLEARHQLLSPLPSRHYTLVLVDRSSSVTAPRHAQQLEAAVNSVMRRVSADHWAAVYAFDGSPHLQEVVPFTDRPVPTAGSKVARIDPTDPSTNLHGAVMDALAQLDGAVAEADQALRFGTLLLLSDGTDRADRVPWPTMREALRQSGFNAVVVAVGAEMNPDRLERIARDGYLLKDPEPGQLGAALDTVFDDIVRHAGAYYQLSYCSPARSGIQQLRIDVTRGGAKGGLVQSFDATGFGPGCDPARIRPPVPRVVGNLHAR
jgi:hypothetical protein